MHACTCMLQVYSVWLRNRTKRKSARKILLFGKPANQESLPGQVHGVLEDQAGTLSVLSWLGKIAGCLSTVLVPVVKSIIILGSNILGEKADIHTGGEDLKFPHHDNEMAQVEVH